MNEKNQTNSLPAKLLNFCNKLSDIPNLVELVNKREAALNEHQRLQMELGQLDTRDLDALKLKADALAEAIKKRKTDEENPLAAKSLSIATETGEKKNNKKQKALK